jgi:hypothetical protein
MYTDDELATLARYQAERVRRMTELRIDHAGLLLRIYEIFLAHGRPDQ